jgi:hypothetical protein
MSGALLAGPLYAFKLWRSEIFHFSFGKVFGIGAPRIFLWGLGVICNLYLILNIML